MIDILDIISIACLFSIFAIVVYLSLRLNSDEGKDEIHNKAIRKILKDKGYNSIFISNPSRMQIKDKFDDFSISIGILTELPVQRYYYKVVSFKDDKGQEKTNW